MLKIGKTILRLLLIVNVLLTFSSCTTKTTNHLDFDESAEVIEVDSSDVLAEDVLTAEEQANLTPDSVIGILKKGNQDFISDALTVRNTSVRVRKAVIGQYPKAVILSCLDSRVPVEDIFHRGLGELFVARVAGNVINEDMLGSLEYACKVSGSKLIVVIGHENCGAIKSAIDDVKLGNITSLLAKIRPAVASSSDFDGEKKSSNKAYVNYVGLKNVQLGIQQIHEKSPILSEMEKSGAIKIIGAIYKMESGKIEFL